jgi:PKD repeat protein
LFDSTYYWTFGDSSSSILENPTHTYATQGTYNVRFIVTNMCGSDTVNINITIVSGAGIEENNIVQNLVICPIPARDLLNVSFETGNSHGIEIKIVNTLGQLLYNESSESFTGKYNKVFDMLKYQSGIYYLHIITDKGIVNRKIEVN